MNRQFYIAIGGNNATAYNIGVCRVQLFINGRHFGVFDDVESARNTAYQKLALMKTDDYDD